MFMTRMAKGGLIVGTLRALRDPHAPTALKVLFLAAIAYVVLPLDFAPDVIPVLGWADDALILLLSAVRLRSAHTARVRPPIPRPVEFTRAP